MPDKFPEAFRRFEQQKNIEDIKDFSELLREFGSWQNYQATDLQKKCLANQVDTKDIIRKWVRQQIKYKYGTRDIFRDKKSGRFTIPR